MFGAIEAGGTKFVCAVADRDLKNIKRISFKTGYPDETLEQVYEFFDSYKDLKSIGIGSFGPIDVNKKSEKYGYVTSTPKPGWENFNFLGSMKDHYNIPIGWTTDVNVACLAEYERGIAKEDDSCIYLTVGTGIGGGAIMDGEFVEGFGHPEMGHIIVRKHEDDDFNGWCIYHEDCLEGLAAGPSIEKRLGIKAENLDKDDKVWDFIAFYLAQALVNYSLILRPDKLILGGGVMKQSQLLPKIKDIFLDLLAGYINIPPVDQYIVTPELGDDTGVIGGLLLARKIWSDYK